MQDNNLELRKELMEKELNKLINDFSGKRKKYRTKYMILCWITVVVNAGISFSVGISFIEEVALQFQVIALLLSSVLVILNGAMSFLNYKNLYEQRTKTYINLLSLRREFKFRLQYSGSESDLTDTYNELQKIMENDLELWIENNPKEKGDEGK